MAIQAEQERLALEAKVAPIDPKVEAFDRISACEGSLGIVEVAKVLKVTPDDLYDVLATKRWIYKVGGRKWVGNQEKINAGLIEHSIERVCSPNGNWSSVKL